MTHLIIARHGNTFSAGEIPRRVGARTDLPLVASGIEQARKIGQYFREHQIIPDVVYSATLMRTKQTASYALPGRSVIELDTFNEIDYGPDENKTEAEVIARIGKQALEDWDRAAIVPTGWQVNPQQMIQTWHDFAAKICQQHKNQVVLVVTSNGVARFAPHLTKHFDTFRAEHAIKLKTGALALLRHDEKRGWVIREWNIRP